MSSCPETAEDARPFFEMWGGYLIWENDVSEFALGCNATGARTQFFEVRRGKGEYHIRRIAKLTRPIIDHGAPFLAPIAFTEPQVLRDAYYRNNPKEKPRSPTWDLALAPKLPPRAPAYPAFSEQETSARRFIATFDRALAGAKLRPLGAKADTLWALLELHPTNSSAGTPPMAAADSIIAMATAFLDAEQLELLRGHLYGKIQNEIAQTAAREKMIEQYGADINLIPQLDQQIDRVSPVVSPAR